MLPPSPTPHPPFSLFAIQRRRLRLIHEIQGIQKLRALHGSRSTRTNRLSRRSSALFVVSSPRAGFCFRKASSFLGCQPRVDYHDLKGLARATGRETGGKPWNDRRRTFLSRSLFRCLFPFSNLLHLRTSLFRLFL